MRKNLPQELDEIAAKLHAAGFEAHLVGGCVRDFFLGRKPKDWDVATNAKPEEIQKIFPDSVYENQFGTVGVKTGSEDETLKVVEVTTYRIEGRYTDKRHPDEVKFAKTIEEDLSRRDFTINAIAIRIQASPSSVDGRWVSHMSVRNPVDPFGGIEHLKHGVVKTVGKPEERFSEDALRLMRAVRFAVELGFEIERETEEAIKTHAGSLEMIAKERVRDELIKILETPRASQGILLLEEFGLLRYVLPELREGIGVNQNKHHIYTVFEHHVRSLEYAAQQNCSLPVRLAALLHDLGKPKTKQGEGSDATFHGHEVVGAKMAAAALARLRFPKETIEEVVHLVRYHMFYYNVGEVSPAGVRRFLARVGPETVPDLIKLREADRIGSGVPKAVPYKLRHFLFMIEKVKHDPISPKMLKINGQDVMSILGIPPGPKVGFVLAVLLEEVLDDPKKNEKGYLEKRAKELGESSENDLALMAKRAREKKGEFEEGIEAEMKRKHYVK